MTLSYEGKPALFFKSGPEIRDVQPSDGLTGTAFRPTEVTAGNVCVEVTYSGICGSDVEWAKKDLERPMIGGHEVIGVVREVGEGVTHVKVGDIVVVDPQVLAAGPMDLMEALGRPNLSPKVQFPATPMKGPEGQELGHGWWGGGPVVVPQANVFPIPAGKIAAEAPELFALAEPMACLESSFYQRGTYGARTVEQEFAHVREVARTKLGVEYTPSALILGDGGIGIMSALKLATVGAQKIYLTGLIREDQVNRVGEVLARDYGCELVYLKMTGKETEADITGKHVADVKKGTWKGMGVDVVVSALPHESWSGPWLNAVRPAGYGVILLGSNTENIPMPSRPTRTGGWLLEQGRRHIGGDCFPRAIAFIDKHADLLRTIVSDVVAADKGGPQVIQDLGKFKVLDPKVILSFPKGWTS
jgi:threonine dehydrogenase-like Zn-dependent dehydrogenase